MAEPIGRWVALLDELDRQLALSRAGFGLTTASIGTIDEIRASIGPLGPLPASLIPHGQRILADYEQEISRILATKRLLGEHIEMLQSARGSEGAQPVYFDRVG